MAIHDIVEDVTHIFPASVKAAHFLHVSRSLIVKAITRKNLIGKRYRISYTTRKVVNKRIR